VVVVVAVAVAVAIAVAAAASATIAKMLITRKTIIIITMIIHQILETSKSNMPRNKTPKAKRFQTKKSKSQHRR